MHSSPYTPSETPTVPPAWLPVVGMNSNVTVQGEDYHVQTEDLAPKRPQLVSHVFREGGCVVKVTRLDYSRHLDRPNLHTILTRVMKVFHAKVIRSLQRERLDSIPPCVSLRPSFPPAASATEPPSEPPAVAEPSPRSQLRASLPVAVDAPDSEPPRSAGHVWDHIIEDRKKGRASLPASANRDEPPPSSTSWDRAVQSVRQTTRTTPLEAVPNEPAPALEAYDQGLICLRQGNAERALVELARAVQLSPQTARYRAALRRALDAMDKD